MNNFLYLQYGNVTSVHCGERFLPYLFYIRLSNSLFLIIFACLFVGEVASASPKLDPYLLKFLKEGKSGSKEGESANIEVVEEKEG